MAHKNDTLAAILQNLDLGSSVAESDHLLEAARVETSAFSDVLQDKVDLIPGTKGSGKSALFRIFVDFLPKYLLHNRKVVIAHGVNNPGDQVFHAFKDEFIKLTEQDFVCFWCIYLVSLAHEHFLKNELYQELLKGAEIEIQQFRRNCEAARIPEINAKKSLRDILQWALHVLSKWRPKISYKMPEAGELQLDLLGDPIPPKKEKNDLQIEDQIPEYVNSIKESLDKILEKTNLSLWLMIDRLDEIFPRRSDLEGTALRGLLRAMRFFSSEAVRVKIFLRDDMLEQVVRGSNGFTALTHITVRQSDTLRWTEEQILNMVVRRLSANPALVQYLSIDRACIEANASYRSETFYKVFPPTVHRGKKQSNTLRWIYSRCADGKGVVTPRDVIDLLDRAKQHQHDNCTSNTEGESNWIIGQAALQYGLQELSKRKRQTYLQAEFPHLWPHIEKFVGGRTHYDEAALLRIFGKQWKLIIDDLVSIGLLNKSTGEKQVMYSVPILYRHGLAMIRGRA